MHLNEYQERAKSTDQQPLGEGMDPNSSEMLVPLLGMVGELGELLEVWPETPWPGFSLRDTDAFQFCTA